MNDLTIFIVAAVIMLYMYCATQHIKKVIMDAEERIITAIKNEANKNQTSLPVPIKTEIHYYPTIYSGDTQIRKRDLELTRKNAEKDFRGYSEWTDIEDKALRQEWKASIGINEIAKLHKRSSGAIIARLVKLGIYYNGTTRYTN